MRRLLRAQRIHSGGHSSAGVMLGLGDLIRLFLLVIFRAPSNPAHSVVL